MQCGDCNKPAPQGRMMCDDCRRNWDNFLAQQLANSHDHNCHAWGCK